MTSVDTPLYRDHTRPLGERVADLIGRMSLEEKVSQLRHGSAAIPRLGIAAYNWWSEGLHGVARNGRATAFPQVIGMAAFERIERRAGERRELSLHVPAERLTVVGDDRAARPITGRLRICVGGCSPGEPGRALGAPTPLEAEIAR